MIRVSAEMERKTSPFSPFMSFFIDQRTYLTAVVEEIISRTNFVILNHVNLYLYGHPSLNFADNQKILLATLRYIKKTARFIS